MYQRIKRNKIATVIISPPNYNPLMLPFKNDFLPIYYCDPLGQFSLLGGSILKQDVENNGLTNSRNYMPFICLINECVNVSVCPVGLLWAFIMAHCGVTAAHSVHPSLNSSHQTGGWRGKKVKPGRHKKFLFQKEKLAVSIICHLNFRFIKTLTLPLLI